MNEQFFQNKVVIVTGGAGFIGSHLCDKLLKAGAFVYALDNLITGNIDNLKQAREHANFHFVEVDLNDVAKTIDELEKIKEQKPIDSVLHFASPASPPLYQKFPTQTYLVNTLALHNLLTWLKASEPHARLVFAGTSEAYGNPAVHPQAETYWGNVNPNGVRSCYDEAKRLGETICGVFERDFNMDTRIVRIFNTYGPRMSLNDGRILPEFIKQYLNKKKLTVYGNGKQTRSYCYIDDLIEGILAMAAQENLKGQTINLGNPRELTVLQTAEIFNKMLGRKKNNLEFLPLPKDDPLKRKPDITKAQKLLHWFPKIKFEDGLKLMVESYPKN